MNAWRRLLTWLVLRLSGHREIEVSIVREGEAFDVFVDGRPIADDAPTLDDAMEAALGEVLGTRGQP